MNALSWPKHHLESSRPRSDRKTRRSGRAQRRPDLERIEDRVLLAADPSQVCTSAVDLIVLVDGSGSVGSDNFNLEKQAVQELVSSFTLGPQTAEIGVIQFGSTLVGQPQDVKLVTGLSPDASAVDAAISGMTYVQASTAMTLAINTAQQEIAAHGRPGVATPIILLLTDGFPTGPDGISTTADQQATLEAASAAKADGTLILAVGVGSAVGDQFLEQVVSQPSSQNYFKTPDFSGLTNVINQVATTTCTIVSTPPQVTSLQRFGFHAQQTQLMLTFSEDMNAATVQDLSNYSLAAIGPHHSRSVRIVSATYDTANRTATLTASHPLPLRLRYQLTVNGSTPTGLANTDHVLLDGAGTGAEGSDYQREFGREILAGPSQRHHRMLTARTASASHAPRGPLAQFRHR